MGRGRIAVMIGLTGAVIVAVAPPARAHITFTLDYTYDTNGFFTANPAAKAALEQAANVYSDRLIDHLTDITSSASNTWNMEFSNPANGNIASIQNQTVPADNIRVYVGGRNLGGALGFGGPGGYSNGLGDATFISNLQYRGQAGAQGSSPTDFGRWGGSIAFDNTVQWNFGLSGPVKNKNDFLTVATHELAHVLGFGTAQSWYTYLTPSGANFVGPFVGPKSVALNGGPVPLETPDPGFNAQHFNFGVMSTVGGITAQETLMDPDITVGTRKKATLLDWAGLDDIGWDLAKPGDANADGTIDFNDLVSLAQSYNVSDGQRRWSNGDFNYDGNVDFNDLVSLAQNYNTSGIQGAPAIPGAPDGFAADWSAAQAVAAGVPEPASGAIAVALMVGGLMKRNRRIRGSS
ncbi:MAG TPA: hypothetical protein VH475_29025 [Tepidisphaeraceae bacterium]|jgi:hypothetical protein